MKIIHTDWGIGYNENDTIEMNRILLKHPKLHKLVLQHEMEHIKNPDFFDTLKIDFKDMFNFEKQLEFKKLPFTMRLQSILPIWLYKGQVCVNPFYMFFYSLLLLIGIIVLL